jgi:hypothetical protein
MLTRRCIQQKENLAQGAKDWQSVSWVTSLARIERRDKQTQRAPERLRKAKATRFRAFRHYTHRTPRAQEMSPYSIVRLKNFRTMPPNTAYLTSWSSAFRSLDVEGACSSATNFQKTGGRRVSNIATDGTFPNHFARNCG